MVSIPKEVDTTEGLLLWLIGYFSETFRNHAILKGGMVLRLLNCPRFTNDLDYLFIPYKSKKEIRPMLEKAMGEIGESSFDLTMDSKCVRIIFSYRSMRVQLEATVTEQCESEALSNTHLGSRYHLNPLLINVQKRDIALSHKIAAWNERNLYRDLFDIYFFVSVLGVDPHIPTLKLRLKRVFRGRANKAVEMTLFDLCASLLAAKDRVSLDSLTKELKGVLPANELVGLDLKIRVAIEQLTHRIGQI